MNVPDSAVVTLLSYVLGLTEEEIRNTPGRYAAYHWDLEFDEAHEINWSTSQVTTAHPDGALVYCRGDFDVAKSIFDVACSDLDRIADAGLRALLEGQDRVLFGEQLHQLVSEGRLPESARNARNVFGRIRGSEGSLVDAARALLMLGDDTPWLPMDDAEDDYTEVDETVAARLAELFDQDVAAHIGLFFQTRDAARRSGGARMDEIPDSEIIIAQYLSSLLPGTELIATWSLGEGLGEEALVRLPSEPSTNLPEEPHVVHFEVNEPLAG